MRLWSTGRHEVDNSIPQRLLPCQVRRLLHTGESGEKVPARTSLGSNLPTQEQAASAGDTLESPFETFLIVNTSPSSTCKPGIRPRWMILKGSFAYRVIVAGECRPISYNHTTSILNSVVGNKRVWFSWISCVRGQEKLPDYRSGLGNIALSSACMATGIFTLISFMSSFR